MYFYYTVQTQLLLSKEKYHKTMNANSFKIISLI